MFIAVGAGNLHSLAIRPDGTVAAWGLNLNGQCNAPSVRFKSVSGGNYHSVGIRAECYANCDGSTASPLLTANDFQCFLNRYAANDPYVNCDGSTVGPIATANDFQCFLNVFAAGCS